LEHADHLVIGGGIIGISVARELKRRRPRSRVVLIEKERACAEHASGRNSGVLHAGFYYTADSLKARFTRVGNALLTDYCDFKKLKINKCGKLVVARNAADLPQLDELLRRGRANGVQLESIDEAAARRIEPRVKTYERAIFSPTTSSVDPVEVTLAMRSDAEAEGISILNDTAYLGHAGRSGSADLDIRTSAGILNCGYVVNCAGLYADKIAMDFGFSEEYRILPFKGLYLYSEEPAGSLKTNVYPVPDLRNPFLGVHFTVPVNGHVKIGPTAIPAFWREQYEGWGRFKAGELADVLLREAGLFLSAGFDFRRLALEEIRKFSRRRMAALAGELVTGVRPEHYIRWGRPGIRAQLMNLKKRTLEMDFVVQGDARSFHVLNAVSPGFTCSLPFASHVCDRIDALQDRSGPGPSARILKEKVTSQ